MAVLMSTCAFAQCDKVFLAHPIEKRWYTGRTETYVMDTVDVQGVRHVWNDQDTMREKYVIRPDGSVSLGYLTEWTYLNMCAEPGTVWQTGPTQNGTHALLRHSGYTTVTLFDKLRTVMVVEEIIASKVSEDSILYSHVAIYHVADSFGIVSTFDPHSGFQTGFLIGAQIGGRIFGRNPTSGISMQSHSSATTTIRKSDHSLVIKTSEFRDDVISVRVYDMLGRLVFEQNGIVVRDGHAEFRCPSFVGLHVVCVESTQSSRSVISTLLY